MTKDEDMALCPRGSRLNEYSGQCVLLFELACLILEFFFPAVQPYFAPDFRVLKDYFNYDSSLRIPFASY